MKNRKKLLVVFAVCAVSLVAVGVSACKVVWDDPKEVSGISLDASGAKTSFLEGEKFTSEGVQMTVYYDNGTNQTVRGGFYVTPPAMRLTAEEAGEDTVTREVSATYRGKTDSYEISIAAFKGIEAKGAKTTFETGEAFSTEGLVVSEVYGNGEKVVVENYEIVKPEGFDMGVPGTYDITVSYEKWETKVETSYQITVEGAEIPARKLTETLKLGTLEKDSYFVGDTLIVPTVTAVYNNNDEVELTADKYTVTATGLEDGKLTKAGEEIVVTVSYEEDGVTATASFTVTVARKLTETLKLGTLEKDSYFVGDTLIVPTVTAVYNNNDEVELTADKYTVTATGLEGGKLTKAGEEIVVTVSYEEDGVTATATFTVTVKVPQVNGIRVLTQPEKTEYVEGEIFDPKGLDVRAVYDNGDEGSENLLEALTFAPDGELTVEDTLITLTYDLDGQKFTAEITITVTAKPEERVEFGGGTYLGLHEIVLGEDTDAYQMTNNANSTWSNSGNAFGRFQANRDSSEMIVTLDYSDLADKSEIGISIPMIAVRAKTLVQVSTDKETWTDIGYAEGDKADAMRYNSNYTEQVTALRGREVNDANLYEFYWSLAEYAEDIGEDGLIYIRLGYTGDYTSELSDNVGADVIDHIFYYDSLRFKQYTLTLEGDVTFVGGGKTAELNAYDALPEIAFEGGMPANFYGWVEAVEASETLTTLESWAAESFRMPTHDLTIRPVFDHDDYVQKTEDGFYYGEGRLHFGEAKKGDSNNVGNLSGSPSITKNATSLPMGVLSDYTTAYLLGFTAKEGAAFRLATGFNVEAYTQYTVTYEFINVGGVDVAFTLHQINAAADTSKGFNTAVTVNAGEKQTVSITFYFTAAAGSYANQNLLSYFVFNMDCTNAKLAVNATVEKGEEVAVPVTGIRIVSQPEKIHYTEGETFDTKGLDVRLTYENGTEGGENIVAQLTFDPSGKLAVGDTVITLTYKLDGKEFTTTITITVTAAGEEVFDDTGWEAYTFYAASGTLTSGLARGVEAINASVLNKRQNKLNYYPIGNQDVGTIITYHVDVTEDATVGLYAEFGIRPNAHTFNEIYKLTVNGVEVNSSVALPKDGTEFESSNTFLFLAVIELKAGIKNDIVIELIDDTGYGYNLYGYRFTAESAEVSLHTARDMEIIDTGYGVKYAGEERVMISGNTPYIIQKSSISNGAWKDWTRLYASTQSTNSYFILEIDRSDLEDVSKVGLVVTQGYGRQGAIMSYSTDKEHWTEFARQTAGTLGGSFHYETQSGFDWYWFADGKDNAFSNDDGPHTCFYEIGKYFGDSKVLYIKAGNTVEGNKVGCDWLGSFSILDYLEVDQEVASGSLATASISTGFIMEGKRVDIALPERTTD